MGAVAEGLNTEPRLAASVSWLPRPSLVYGILRGCQDIVRKCRDIGVDWWHIDLGYFGRGHFDGNYRLSRNGFQANKRTRPPEKETREYPWPAKWKAGNGPIVVCPPTSGFCFYHPFEKIDDSDWTDSVIRALTSITDRPVEVCPKVSGVALPEDPWCVIVHSSNLAIDMLIAGSPAIALGPSLVKDHGPVLDDIEDYYALRNINRNHVLSIAAHSQFTLEEFRSGYAFELSMELQG